MPVKTAIENKQLNDIEKMEGKLILASNPQRIVYEASNACNLRCVMCGQSHREFEGNILAREIFDKTSDFWPTAYDASLFGWGEPLMNRNLIYFFRSLKERGVRVFVLTNGLILAEKYSDIFVKEGLDYLNFSFDSINRATYEEIRRGSNYDTVLKNIRYISELRRKLGAAKPYLRIVMVGMKKNIHELPDFVRFAKDLGMDEVKMVYMIAYGEEQKNEVLFNYKKETNALIDEALNVAGHIGIKTHFPEKFKLDSAAGHADLSARTERKPCYRPWEELFVQSDGKVRLCMLSSEVMGDLSTDSVTGIWNNASFQKIRASINTRNPEGMCKACPQYKEQDINDSRTFLQYDKELPGTKKKP